MRVSTIRLASCSGSLAASVTAMPWMTARVMAAITTSAAATPAPTTADVEPSVPATPSLT